MAELDHQLKESPDAPPLLWRLARVEVHLSMHCEQKGSLEEEKQLLVKGEGEVVWYVLTVHSCSYCACSESTGAGRQHVGVSPVVCHSLGLTNQA